MIPGFATVLAASANDRRDRFIGAGNRLGTVQQNIENDFGVCRTLDAFFNGLAAGEPRLLFKGGTSLSQSFKWCFNRLILAQSCHSGTNVSPRKSSSRSCLDRLSNRLTKILTEAGKLRTT
jgi:hypothetical protein